MMLSDCERYKKKFIKICLCITLLVRKKRLKNVKRKERKIPNRKDVILTMETCFLGISTFIPYARALKYIHELSTFFDGVVTIFCGFS